MSTDAIGEQNYDQNMIEKTRKENNPKKKIEMKIEMIKITIYRKGHILVS